MQGKSTEREGGSDMAGKWKTEAVRQSASRNGETQTGSKDTRWSGEKTAIKLEGG